jgi:hypothetical protein
MIGPANLESGDHFPLFLPVRGVVEVLHTDERSETVRDRVVWDQ